LSRAAAPFALGTVAATAVTFNGVGAGNASGRSDGTITVAVPGGAATAPVVVTVNGVSSNGASFTVTPVPATTSVAPATGAAGTQVTTSGSGSGPAQGAGTVLLGSTYGSVVSWSGSQIVATVASNAQSGNAQVQRGGVWSNAVPFTVITPAISSVTPTSGLPGTPVTITASGFGAAQGNGQVWLGTANGVVQSWSDTQIVAQVGAGAASGNAQVLQNNVMSNRVAFTVNTPQLASISPASGVAGTSVTFTGSGFGASQGVVWLGSMAGQVVSWQDAQVVATVASGAVSGIARVQSGGGLWSNALGFTVPAPGGNTVVPSLLNMVVGDTHTIQALSAGGQSVTGLVWTSSDPTVVSLSTDDPPVLTAVAAGHVTITAGTGSADVTVWPGALGVGTAIWTNPGDGSGVQYIVPAVPSATGVADVFAFQGDGTVQAITSDGTTAWTADVSQVYGSYLEGGPYPGYIAPDFQGGLVGLVGNQAGPFSIVRWDGMTGQVAFTTPTPWLEDLAVHPDGTIFGVQYLDTFPAMGCSAPSDAIVGIDPTTGAQKFSVPVMAGNGGFSPGGMIVAGDGYAYWLYFYVPWPGCPYDGERAYLLRVDSSGAYDNIQIAKGPFGDTFDYFQGYMITNADQGVLLSWQPDEFGYRMLVTAGTSVSVVNAPQVPGQYSPVQPVLQAQDGSFVGTYEDSSGNTNNMVAFDASGNVRWIVPNDRPQIATADGGVIGASGIAYDANGNATGQMSPLTQTWTGDEYSSSGVVSAVNAAPVFSDGADFWPVAGGNPSGNGTAFAQCPCLLQSAIAAPSSPSSDMVAASAGGREALRPQDVSPPSPPPPPLTYVILAGDPGLNLPNHEPHNVQGLFNLAAGTEQDRLNALGNLAYPPIRVSSVQDFESQLVGNGPITGGVVCFGHGAGMRYSDGTRGSVLAPGEQAGPDTNVSEDNVTTLKNVQLDPKATITLHACYAGYGWGRHSIAQWIANQLQRRVYAPEAGTFFSVDPKAKAPVPLPNMVPKPVYLLQDGGEQFTCFGPYGVGCP
jgi:hypothetical protein